MENEKEILSVSVLINKSLDLVWNTWNDDSQMHNWLFISNEFETKNPRIDLKLGGSFSYSMASKTGDFDFEYRAVYTAIELKKRIAFTLIDGRKAEVKFSTEAKHVHLQIDFEPVVMQDNDVQLAGWQAILTNFKRYVESLSY